MKALIIISVLSLLGALVIFFARLIKIRKIPEEEFLYSLKDTQPFFSEFYKLIVVPSKRFYREEFLPKFFKQAEISVHWFRIHILKFEHALFNLKHYFRGKHDVQADGHSPYWKDMREYKEGLKEENKNVE
jgi:hypothetical protein